MSESKFTPGEWSIGWRLTNLGGEERQVTAIGGGAGEWVALLPHGWFDGFGVVEDGELKANAALIAAAPELFEALKEMAAMYTHAWDRVGGGLLMMEGSVERFDAACERARAALSKAKGSDQ